MVYKHTLSALLLLAASAAGSYALADDSNAVLISNAAIGAIDANSKVPAINAINGSSVTTWSIATPIAQLTSGQSYMFTAAFQDFSYTGQCYVQAVFTQVQNGKKVKLKSVTQGPEDCEAGKTYLTGVATGKMPDAPGSVTMTVNIIYGTGKATMKVPLVLQ